MLHADALVPIGAASTKSCTLPATINTRISILKASCDHKPRHTNSCKRCDSRSALGSTWQVPALKSGKTAKNSFGFQSICKI